jgi:hypothetical protein
MSLDSSLLRQLVAQQNLILQELEYIRQNTRALVTGEAIDAGWDIKQYGTNLNVNLPGRPNNILNPGDSVTIISEKDTVGQFIVATLVTDNPFVSSNLETKSQLNTWNTTITLNPFIIDQAGLDFVNDRTPFNTRYDKTNNAFASVWYPSLMLGYHNGIKLTIDNPSQTLDTGANNTPATIQEVIIVRLVYSKNQKLFLPSATTAQIPPNLPSSLNSLDQARQLHDMR